MMPARRVARRTSRRTSRRMSAAQEQQQAAPAQAAPAQAAPAQAAPAQQDDMAEIQQLAAMKDQGILTEEEFQAKKKQILGI
jgi:hypothetical protein